MMGNWGCGSGYISNAGFMGFGLGGIISLIFWIIIIVAIIWLAKEMIKSSQLQQGGRMAQEDSALKILRERFARGDITKEEFEVKKKDLMTK